MKIFLTLFALLITSQVLSAETLNCRFTYTYDSPNGQVFGRLQYFDLPAAEFKFEGSEKYKRAGIETIIKDEAGKKLFEVRASSLKLGKYFTVYGFFRALETNLSHSGKSTVKKEFGPEHLYMSSGFGRHVMIAEVKDRYSPFLKEVEISGASLTCTIR